MCLGGTKLLSWPFVIGVLVESVFKDAEYNVDDYFVTVAATVENAKDDVTASAVAAIEDAEYNVNATYAAGGSLSYYL